MCLIIEYGFEYSSGNHDVDSASYQEAE